MDDKLAKISSIQEKMHTDIFMKIYARFNSKYFEQQNLVKS